MPRLAVVLALLLVCAPASQAAAAAADAPPSEASVRELLALAGTHVILDQMATRYRATIKAAMEKPYQGKNLNEDQQRIEADSVSKSLDILGGLMSWDSVSPVFVEVYASTFTQGEVNDLIKFFKSPTGKTYAAKQPEVMQKATTLMQNKVTEVMPELTQLAIDTAQQMRAASTPAAAAAPATAPAPAQ